MDNDQLAGEGFELCEFGGECEDCGSDMPQGELFFERTCYEALEGNYLCRECCIMKIELNNAIALEWENKDVTSLLDQKP